jgi:hypothetical protein
MQWHIVMANLKTFADLPNFRMIESGLHGSPAIFNSLPMEGDRKPRPFVQTKFDEYDPVFSPDGLWIAYISNETGRFEIYVQPFPGPGGKWQISTEGGLWPVWASEGRELFYLTISTNRIMSVSVMTRPSFTASAPRFIADLPSLLPSYFYANGNYDVSSDGQLFLFVKMNRPDAPSGELRVILNWDEELKHLAPQASNHDWIRPSPIAVGISPQPHQFWLRRALASDWE